MITLASLIKKYGVQIGKSSILVIPRKDSYSFNIDLRVSKQIGYLEAIHVLKMTAVLPAEVHYEVKLSWN